MDTSSVPGLELIQIADAVAREKSIDRDEVITAMEEAIQKAGRSKYGQEHDIRAMMIRLVVRVKPSSPCGGLLAVFISIKMMDSCTVYCCVVVCLLS